MAVLKRARKNLNRKTDRDRTQASSTPQPKTRIRNSNWRKKPSEQPAQYAYPGCGKILSSSSNMKKHYQSQHTGPRSRVECEYPSCDATFVSKVPMEYHYRVQHLGQPRNSTNRSTQCNFPGCGRIFSSLENQRYHYRRTHLSISRQKIAASKSLPCTYPGCDKSFLNKYTLKTHYQGFYVARSDFRCKHCEWYSPDKTTFLIHLFRAHDQRQLLIVPPKPGLEITALKSFLQSREKESHKAAQIIPAADQESNLLSRAIGQDPSPSLPDRDPRLRKSEGISVLTVRERNDTASRCAIYWLDKSKANAPCIGPVSARQGSKVTSPSTSDEGCLFGMTLSLDTALLVPKLHSKLPDNLFFCLKLLPRCLHCDTMYSIMALGALSTIQALFINQKNKQTCQAKNCRRSPWQGVGAFCDMHYMIMPYLNSFTWSRRAAGCGIMSRSLIEKLDGPSILHEMVHRIFKWQTSELSEILPAILDPHPNAPKVYAVDTEFYQPKSGGAIQITELAFVDVKTGQVVVNAAFDDQRAIDASRKLKLQPLRWNALERTSTVKHIHQVRTVTGMVRQLKNCHLGPNDKLVEYSLYSQSLLDVRNLGLFLEQSGYRRQDLLSASKGYAVIRSTRDFLQQAMKPKTWSLPFLFRILFPQDPLVDQNHSAAVDVIQLAQILRLLAELSKSPEERNLPEGLLQGIDKLMWLDENRVLSKTIDDYFKPVGYAASNATMQIQNGKSDEEVNWEENNDGEDAFVEGIGAIKDVEHY